MTVHKSLITFLWLLCGAYLPFSVVLPGFLEWSLVVCCRCGCWRLFRGTIRFVLWRFEHLWSSRSVRQSNLSQHYCSCSELPGIELNYFISSYLCSGAYRNMKVSAYKLKAIAPSPVFERNLRTVFCCTWRVLIKLLITAFKLAPPISFCWSGAK